MRLINMPLTTALAMPLPMRSCLRHISCAFANGHIAKRAAGRIPSGAMFADGILIRRDLRPVCLCPYASPQ
jgi:hypothetical protein